MNELRYKCSVREFPNRLKNGFLSVQPAARAVLFLFQAALGVFGAGPALRYTIPLSSRNLSLIVKWIHEFYTHDRFAGDYVYVCFATRL